jgi:ribonuclease D
LCRNAFAVKNTGLIDNDQKLAALLPKLRAAQWLALDTEADSLHAYPEKVCLIQISIAGCDVLVDPLAEINLNPLFEVFNAHELIFHAADYDLRLLGKHHHFIPAAIFDTMLAARLLGEQQFGLGALVENLLGVKLDKGSQKADWAQRPLTERMEIYARNDTHYLKPLADKLKAALEAKNRLTWHQQSCSRLIADCSRPPVVDADTVWRVKGSSILNRPALALLRELWQWREKEAIAYCRPPFFILSHERMVDICDAAAAQQPFDHILPPKLSPRRRETLLETIKVALTTPTHKYPEILRPKFHRPNEAEFRRFRELEKIRNRHAHELGIDPTLIAAKSVLGDLSRDWDQHAPELMDWQRALLK